MKTLLLAVLFLASPLGTEDYKLVRDPSFGGKNLMLLHEFPAKKAATMWRIDDAEVEEVKTDSGEVLRTGSYMFDLSVEGDSDPRSKRLVWLPAGSAIISIEFRKETQPFKTIPRIAGSYELLHGGEERWVTLDHAALADVHLWEQEDLKEGGFELQGGVRAVQLLKVMLKDGAMDVDEVHLRAAGSDELISSWASSGGLGYRVHEFRLTDVESEGLVAVLELDEGPDIVVENLPMGTKAKAAKSGELRKAKLKLESHVVTVTEVHAKGSGNYDLIRGFRWVSSKGKDLGIHPNYHYGGGIKTVSASCMAPSDLPRGAQLQFGVLVGAR
ncbi:MAG: hypothetical protein ABGY29_17575, partial [bacterium]